LKWVAMFVEEITDLFRTAGVDSLESIDFNLLNLISWFTTNLVSHCRIEGLITSEESSSWRWSHRQVDKNEIPQRNLSVLSWIISSINSCHQNDSKLSAVYLMIRSNSSTSVWQRKGNWPCFWHFPSKSLWQPS
jgi:hypothetical protein